MRVFLYIRTWVLRLNPNIKEQVCSSIKACIFQRWRTVVDGTWAKTNLLSESDRTLLAFIWASKLIKHRCSGRMFSQTVCFWAIKVTLQAWKTNFFGRDQNVQPSWIEDVLKNYICEMTNVLKINNTSYQIFSVLAVSVVICTFQLFFIKLAVLSIIYWLELRVSYLCHLIV